MNIIEHNFKDPYEKIIKDNLGYIEQQSLKIIKKHFADHSKSGDSKNLEIENRFLELSNAILDNLKKDDYKILRNFNGKSKITTYLTTIISRQFVDIIRKKMGRNREKERAKEFGELGLRVYNSVFIDKATIEEFNTALKYEGHSNTDIKQIEKIIDRIKGKSYDKKDIDNFPETPVQKGIVYDEGNEIIITDKYETPENQLIFNEKKRSIKSNIEIVLSELTEEEKFILKLRFYNDKERKKEILKNIASFLNVNKRTANNKINSILKKSKKILSKNGIISNDLF